MGRDLLRGAWAFILIFLLAAMVVGLLVITKEGVKTLTHPTVSTPAPVAVDTVNVAIIEVDGNMVMKIPSTMYVDYFHRETPNKDQYELHIGPLGSTSGVLQPKK